MRRMAEHITPSPLGSIHSPMMKQKNEDLVGYDTLILRFTHSSVDIMNGIWLQINNDRLHQCPLKNPKRVLDVGTGTGIWAMEFADQHPAAEVIGIDLSDTQERWVPSNCSFQLDDLEKEWTFRHPFDFVFLRSMTGSFKSWESVLEQAYKHLEPGGWIEIQDHMYPLTSNEKETIEGTAILEWTNYLVEAADKLGRPISVAVGFEEMLKKLGFVDVEQIKDQVPMNNWPKDNRYRHLGFFCRHMLLDGIEGISMALLTRGLNWSSDDVYVFLARVRVELLDTKIHGYWPVHIVYGRKPENV